ARKSGRDKTVQKGNDRRLTCAMHVGKRAYLLDIFPPPATAIRTGTKPETWPVDLTPVNPPDWTRGRRTATRRSALDRRGGLGERCKANPGPHMHHANRRAITRTTLAKSASDKAQRAPARALCTAGHLEEQQGKWQG